MINFLPPRFRPMSVGPIFDQHFPGRHRRDQFLAPTVSAEVGRTNFRPTCSKPRSTGPIVDPHGFDRGRSDQFPTNIFQADVDGANIWPTGVRPRQAGPSFDQPLVGRCQRSSIPPSMARSATSYGLHGNELFYKEKPFSFCLINFFPTAQTPM